MGALIFALRDQEECGIPAGIWLAVELIMLTLEGVTIEMRERMKASLYW